LFYFRTTHPMEPFFSCGFLNAFAGSVASLSLQSFVVFELSNERPFRRQFSPVILKYGFFVGWSFFAFFFCPFSTDPFCLTAHYRGSLIPRPSSCMNPLGTLHMFLLRAGPDPRSRFSFPLIFQCPGKFGLCASGFGPEGQVLRTPPVF